MADAPSNSNPRYGTPATEGWLVSEAKSNPVRDKSFQFALQIIKLSQVLVNKGICHIGSADAKRDCDRRSHGGGTRC